MATAASPAPPAAPPLKGVQPLRAGQGNSYLWRKLHSLSGIIPIGAFLVEHIVSNFETAPSPTPSRSSSSTLSRSSAYSSGPSSSSLSPSTPSTASSSPSAAA
jgi:hypothetical protein